MASLLVWYVWFQRLMKVYMQQNVAPFPSQLLIQKQFQTGGFVSEVMQTIGS